MEEDHVEESTTQEEAVDDKWILELETALLSSCDMNVIRKISNQKLIPNSLRNEYWQVCLGIKGRVKVLEDIFDLPEQNQIRNDCNKLVDNRLDNSSSEKLSILSDLESIITNFSRLYNCPYESSNGWIELLEKLIHLNVKRDELFKVFESIQLRYISKYYNYRDHKVDQSSKSPSFQYLQPFHLLRLLLLYHDPELCNFFDSLKLTPESYTATWFRSLFCSLCDHSVSLILLDNYFTYANPFLVFFLSLVMIVNLKEELTVKTDRDEIIKTLSTIPSSLSDSDIKDMFFIADQHFLSKTPSSIRDFESLLFQVYQQTEVQSDLCQLSDLSSLLCLPISVNELIASCENEGNLHYFVVDCRPPDQYNNGHLSTAFHLDCSLMLNDPSAFSIAIQALLQSQKQAIDAKSVAAGEHLCFMGSGREEEDCYVHMVVSSFLQKHHRYVSLLYGGYESLHRYIMERQIERHHLADHCPKMCLSCKANQSTMMNGKTTLGNESKLSKDVDQITSVFFQKFSKVVKPKITEMKDKLVEYVANPNQKPIVKHVSSMDKLGQRYKGNKFSLDDQFADFDCDEEDEFGEEIKFDNRQEVNIEEWKKKMNPIGFFECYEIISDGTQIPGYLAMTESNLFILKESKNRKDYGTISVQRPLEMIVQITSKRRHPEIITFKYGHAGPDNESVLIAKDSIFLQNPFDVTRMIKQQVVKLLDQNSSNTD